MNKNIPRIAGLILILTGLFSYILNPERPPTALIGPFIGVIILFSSIKLDRTRNRSFWINSIVSILFGLLSLSMLYKSYSLPDSDKKTRRIIVFCAMGLTCIGNGTFVVLSSLMNSKTPE